MKHFSKLLFSMLVSGSFSVVSHAASLECTNWEQNHADWIWCDDFESDSSLEGNYFEVSRVSGFGVSGESFLGGSHALKSTYVSGRGEHGNIKLSFGRTPISGKPTLNSGTDYKEVYWRIYMRMDENWAGNGFKLMRAISFARSDWTQSMIAHVWQDSGASRGIAIDPVSGVDGASVITSGYNDFSNMKWLGMVSASTQIYSSSRVGDNWECIEARVKLNSKGQRDGVFQLWINGELEAARTDLDWHGSYSSYGINAIFLENYNGGEDSGTHSRYMDNFVVSTSRIGCLGAVVSPPLAPSNMSVF